MTTLADLTRVPIKYVLEIHKAGAIHEKLAVSLPNTPEFFRVSRPAATSAQYTLGHSPVREHSLNRLLTLELVGRSGTAHRSGYNQKGDVVFEDGPTILKEFDAFLEEYQRLSASEGAHYLEVSDSSRGPKNNFTLVFRALFENAHYLVEPQEFLWIRNAARSRHSYEWFLTLRAYGPAKRNVRENILGSVANAFRAVADGINSVASAMAAVDNVLVNVRGDLEVLRAPLQALKNVAVVGQQVLGSVGNITQFPKDVLSDLAIASEEFRELYEDSVLLIQNTGTDLTQYIRDAQARIEESILRLGEAEGLVSGPRSVSAQTSRSALALAQKDSPSSYRRSSEQTPGSASLYEMRTGDTLRSLAHRFLGDSARWIEIAYLNGWLSDDRDAQGRPVQPGVVIRLPLAEDDGGIQGIGASSTMEDRFGRDLYLDPHTGDLALTGAGIRTVRGRDNLEQALRNRLTTVQGNASLFPSYGLPLAPGDPVSAQALGYVGAVVREQVMSDPRITEVSDLEIVDQGDGLSVVLSVRPSTSGAFRIIAPLAIAA